jgi:hypothetical protein
VKTNRWKAVDGREAGQSSDSFNTPVTKESILLSKQQDLPKVRISRDLGRMQWIVECNDTSMKKVFERCIGKRRQHGQGAGKLLTHLSPAKQPAVGLGGDASPGKEKWNASASSPGGVSATSSHPPTSPRNQLGDKKSVPDIPQSLIFNKDSKRVSGHMQVHYVPPRVSYDGTQQPDQCKTSITSTASVSAQGNHIDHQENSAKCHRGPLTFRAALQKYSCSPNTKEGGASGTRAIPNYHQQRPLFAKNAARPGITPM